MAAVRRPQHQAAIAKLLLFLAFVFNGSFLTQSGSTAARLSEFRAPVETGHPHIHMAVTTMVTISYLPTQGKLQSHFIFQERKILFKKYLGLNFH